jgi:hypothetical protein
MRRMRFACWITKATDTHSEYVILIAFSLQQWLRERASMLRYTYIACLVSIRDHNNTLLICTKLPLQLNQHQFFRGVTMCRWVSARRFERLCCLDPELQALK